MSASNSFDASENEALLSYLKRTMQMLVAEIASSLPRPSSSSSSPSPSTTSISDDSYTLEIFLDALVRVLNQGRLSTLSFFAFFAPEAIYRGKIRMRRKKRRKPVRDGIG